MKTETGEKPVLLFAYRPLSREISNPNTPITAIPEMRSPIGILPVLPGRFVTWKVGMTKGPGGVKVGKRVGGISMINWAARVGSIVGVVSGVGVGGGSTTRTLPSRVTSGA